MVSFLEENLLEQRGHKAFMCDGKVFLHSSAACAAIASQAWHRAVGSEECGIIVGYNEGGMEEIFSESN